MKILLYTKLFDIATVATFKNICLSPHVAIGDKVGQRCSKA